MKGWKNGDAGIAPMNCMSLRSTYTGMFEWEAFKMKVNACRPFTAHDAWRRCMCSRLTPVIGVFEEQMDVVGGCRASY